jgi:hypothetical protein
VIVRCSTSGMEAFMRFLNSLNCLERSGSVSPPAARTCSLARCTG